ncbi:MAG: ABC transporter ATP-binding protein [Candidatus Thorarchaeota archaeon]
MLVDQNSSKNVIIKCEALEKYYKDTEENVHALRGIDLEIKKGEFVAIIGSSGSGKTTLLNLIGGLDKISEGKILYNGQDISQFSENERTLYRREIGFIFQEFNLHSVLTAGQNVELPMIYCGKLSEEERRNKVEFLLTKVGLKDRIHHLPTELSSGEKQRVGIARALANSPKIILGDQPTGNLDSKKGEEIIQLLQELRKEMDLTILIVTHNLEEAKKADRIFAIEDGNLASDIKIE